MKCFRPRPQGSNWNVNWLTRMVQTCDELVNEQVCDGSLRSRQVTLATQNLQIMRGVHDYLGEVFPA